MPCDVDCYRGSANSPTRAVVTPGLANICLALQVEEMRLAF